MACSLMYSSGLLQSEEFSQRCSMSLYHILSILSFSALLDMLAIQLGTNEVDAHYTDRDNVLSLCSHAASAPTEAQSLGSPNMFTAH